MYNILIVDDEKMVSEVLQQILSRFGYHAEVALGGHEALCMFDDGLFDLVITDIRMPGVDGYDVVRHIRNSDRPYTPIIGISGTPWLLKDHEFDGIIPKPFGTQTLLSAVKSVMSRALALHRGAYGKTLPAEGESHLT
ncbi:MAG: response regulator [Deltaproteobacteria bacterium]|nr:response regulator [Deltaproteobacteria bacterium]MBW2020151.1 response regulator [Deltaproteobacteria bacterium]MBW2075066.1 response regulator [Deltaproteobacteria bacterium]RLB81644.1 MAG: hypothetical protein DRH17_08515 [Deltaproteobacteria bacterium]